MFGEIFIQFKTISLARSDIIIKKHYNSKVNKEKKSYYKTLIKKTKKNHTSANYKKINMSQSNKNQVRKSFMKVINIIHHRV